jgi:geranylgeranyl pyrophosphate synthase
MLGEVGAEKEQALREYGFSLGIMFQLVDDLLGLHRRRRSARQADRRRSCAKARSRCRSFILLNHGGLEASDLIRNAVRDRDITPGELERLKALLQEHRSIEYAYDRAVEFGENAKRQLRLFAPARSAKR